MKNYEQYFNKNFLIEGKIYICLGYYSSYKTILHFEEKNNRRGSSFILLNLEIKEQVQYFKEACFKTMIAQLLEGKNII